MADSAGDGCSRCSRCRGPDAVAGAPVSAQERTAAAVFFVVVLVVSVTIDLVFFGLLRQLVPVVAR